MTDKPKRQPNSDGWISSPGLREIVNEIAEVADEVLSEWECVFIESIHGKTSFTPNQADKIQQIYEKVCNSPH